MKKNYVLEHNFGYGQSIDDKDSVINKLNLKNIFDLKTYIKYVIEEQFINVKVENNLVAKIPNEPKTKIVIEII